MELMKLYEALAKAQVEFGAVEKAGKTTQYKGGYPKLIDMHNATREVLSKYSLTIIQYLKSLPDSNILIMTRLAHSSGEYIESEYLVVRAAKTEQQIGAAITYGRKYSYGAILSLAPSDNDDDDAKSLKEEHKEPDRKVTKEQAEYIRKMLNGDFDLANEMLEHLGVERITDIPASKYNYVVQQLSKSTP